ncbi:hypothetical protein [Novacetimonas hansenii]|uniref:hypothetical protein n=1 Tax=Novacetimonas hansenii TaxID=436 RepID=UPI000AE2CED5|nr:hypothetical protein [Novacetimonas hansenii]
MAFPADAGLQTALQAAAFSKGAVPENRDDFPAGADRPCVPGATGRDATERGNHMLHTPYSMPLCRMSCVSAACERVFENKSLIKKKSFWVLPFFKKAASSEAFWKKLHQKPL